MNRIEQIKLIADFMDSDYQEIENLCRIDLHEKGFRTEEILGNPERWTCYHNDFSCLMEVVEKIEDLGYWTEICFSVLGTEKRPGKIHWCEFVKENHTDLLKNDSYTKIARGEGNRKLQAIYNAVIKFIKWYNENK